MSFFKNALSKQRRFKVSITTKYFNNSQCRRGKIYNNVLELIKNSSVVRLNKIPKSEGVQCEILAKCEFLLPGGSCKDRIAKRMIEDAEKQGVLKSGYTLIEPSSGNTGISLAMIGAVKGYKVVITTTEKMSQEKQDILNALGSVVIRTPSNLPHDHPDSNFCVAERLLKEIPNSVMLDQYTNRSNVMAHYEETAEEIWEQCDAKLDYLVIGVGTGGTISGIGKKLKEKNPNLKVIGVDPYGSVIEDMEEHPKFHSYKIEGIGYDFVPANVDRSVIDGWVKTEDKESFRMARRMIKEEGLMIGGSCGSVLVGAIRVAKKLPQDKRVLILLIDGIRNYLTKFLNDDWMMENEFITEEEYDELQKTSDNVVPYGNNILISQLNLKKVTPVTHDISVDEALAQLATQEVDCLPVLDEANKLKGIISSKIIANGLSHYKTEFNRSIDGIICEKFRVLKNSDHVGHLQKAFHRHKAVIIEGENDSYYICEAVNLLYFFMNNKNN
jgi:cystathionine beta-synthase